MPSVSCVTHYSFVRSFESSARLFIRTRDAMLRAAMQAAMVQMLATLALAREPAAQQRWLVYVRIPRTASTFLSESVRIRNRGCNCGYTQCRCQTKARSSFHGRPCSEMQCVTSCARDGCRSMWRNTPHADMLDLQCAFVRAQVRPDEIDYMTMLREPVDRVISEYEWGSHGLPRTCDHASKGSVFAWDYELPCNASLASFLASPAAGRRVNNRQTKILAGLGDFEADDVFPSDEAMLAAARRNLQSMRWFGLHERLNSSLWLLEHVAERSAISLDVAPSRWKRSTKSARKLDEAGESERSEIRR